jgi:hypothetical protein
VLVLGAAHTTQEGDDADEAGTTITVEAAPARIQPEAQPETTWPIRQFFYTVATEPVFQTP